MDMLELLKILLGFTGLIISILVCYALTRVVIYEGKINYLYRVKKGEIEKTKKEPPRAKPYIDGDIKNIEEKYNPQIEELERKRRYILEKLPFIKH